jgi:diguanylate cyclase (GGDEF)-like protein
MVERRREPRTRTLRAGRILLNNKGSVIDCTVRNLSAHGAAVDVASVVGIPGAFDLHVVGEDKSRPCRVAWQAGQRLGLAFVEHAANEAGSMDRYDQPPASSPALGQGRRDGEQHAGPDLVRSELIRLKAALDVVPDGVVLLDHELRAQFLNRAFRKMFRMPDAKADSKPPFVALMYHGRDIRIYAIPDDELSDYVAARVTHVKSGDPRPIDIRLANGEILRFQCTVLPAGGRMLTYTYVTDIVTHSDELEILRSALSEVKDGVILLDRNLNAQFMNRAVRQLWRVPDEQAERRPPYSELVNASYVSGVYGVPREELGDYIAQRLRVVRAGDPTPVDLRVSDGRIIRSQCTVLPTGGRMLTYTDVTDLVRNAEQLNQLATTDGMTGLCNRRHFLALAETEFDRVQRYDRPLSLLIVDIDRFKFINDNFGHDAGDRTILQVAEACKRNSRTTDVVARIGGDEFALLLPETALDQARIVAERLCHDIADARILVGGSGMAITASLGVAEAALSMSSIDALMKAADIALYKAKSDGRNRVVCGGALPGTEYRSAAE